MSKLEFERYFDIDMGLVVEMCCNSRLVLLYRKRKLRSTFLKFKAQFLNQKKKNNKLSFHYDPLSYALNFDNGNFGFFCL
ncbi:hypothetical protein BC332_12971 [Capsicum chinense]|nr:hypothetical protein BC332_12971 [Capsicum chinense]